MLNAKFLIASGAAAASAWKLSTDPRLWNIVFDVALAVLASWLIFLCVFFLTAAHMRRRWARSVVDPGSRHRSEVRRHT